MNGTYINIQYQLQTIRTELLGKKTFPLDGQTSWPKLPSRTVNLPCVWLLKIPVIIFLTVSFILIKSCQIAERQKPSFFFTRMAAGDYL